MILSHLPYNCNRHERNFSYQKNAEYDTVSGTFCGCCSVEGCTVFWSTLSQSTDRQSVQPLPLIRDRRQFDWGNNKQPRVDYRKKKKNCIKRKKERDGERKTWTNCWQVCLCSLCSRGLFPVQVSESLNRGLKCLYVFLINILKLNSSAFYIYTLFVIFRNTGLFGKLTVQRIFCVLNPFQITCSLTFLLKCKFVLRSNRISVLHKSTRATKQD